MRVGERTCRDQEAGAGVFVDVGLTHLTTVCSLTGLISSPNSLSPSGGTASQRATSLMFGMVAETATKRTLAMGI
jgi:hypothetical protein